MTDYPRAAHRELEAAHRDVSEVEEMLRHPELGGGTAELTRKELDAVQEKLDQIGRLVDAAQRELAIAEVLDRRDYERLDGIYGEGAE